MLIYNLVVRGYWLLIWLSSLRSEKAAQWVAGRKHWRKNLRGKMARIGNRKKIWVHCASYGEFEQGRPLIEAIREKHPDYAIVLSFFSPSGYEAFKNWNGADVICYLPIDTKNNAKDFIGIVDPAVAIFIKYEFWVNLLFRLKQQTIPTFLVSAVFKPHHPFFKWYGGFFRRSLHTFSKLFIQDEASGKLLQNIGITNYEVSGDTRFDRVLTIRHNFVPLPYFEELCAGKKVLVAGSTWPADEDLLMKVFSELKEPDRLLILVPHHVDEKSISSLVQRLAKSGLTFNQYSSQKVDRDASVLVVDAMGLLSKLYHYANVTYIGGGFDSGIHNCLEPAVYFKPVIFHGGSDYHKYNEAVDMLQQGTAWNISTEADLRSAIRDAEDAARSKEIEKKQEAYFEKNSGTTEKVMRLIRW